MTIAEKLLAHYDAHARALPWRSPPGAPPQDPYHVWLSEIMLQQTTVAHVAPYYLRFTERWPTVEALAAAEDADLMAAWAGLGYYARARNLLACARAVAVDHGGRFPDSEAGMRQLPGVGAYTAAAVAAIAFGEAATVIDANVERVVARLFACSTPLPAGKAAIEAAARTLTPAHRHGDFAQAMMDLGATICTVRAPACMACPIHDDCAAYRAGMADAFPVKAPKKAKPQRRGHVWAMLSEGNIWLERRPPKGLLGGMRALPTSAWGDALPPADPPVDADWQTLANPVTHVFTHFALDLIVHRATVDYRCMGNAHGEWWPIARLKEAGLPTLFAKAARAALG